jgi:hypothetical protein
MSDICCLRSDICLMSDDWFARISEVGLIMEEGAFPEARWGWWLGTCRMGEEERPE